MVETTIRIFQASKRDGSRRRTACTLFIDLITDLPLATQAKVLRVLEHGEVAPTGTRDGRKVDVRLIASSPGDLFDKLDDGSFRSDLYYRLRVAVVDLSPLRKRIDDIIPLANHFVELDASELRRAVPLISSEAQEILRKHLWPGNIRELENAIHRALLVSRSPNIEAIDLQLETGREPENTAKEAEHRMDRLRSSIRELFDIRPDHLLDKVNEELVRGGVRA